jgi:hypothetical protein
MDRRPAGQVELRPGGLRGSLADAPAAAFHHVPLPEAEIGLPLILSHPADYSEYVYPPVIFDAPDADASECNRADLSAVLIEAHPENLALPPVIDEKNAARSGHAGDAGAFKLAADESRHAVEYLPAGASSFRHKTTGPSRRGQTGEATGAGF